MFNLRGSHRLWIAAGLLASASVFLRTVSHGEAIVPHRSLRELPYTLGNWTGHEQPLPDAILQLLGVNDYTSRTYFNPRDGLVQLYLGYYASQRTGDTIHSPKNCLPGAGWEPTRSGYATISVQGARQITVNEYVVQHGLDRDLVFYWYQGRGRVLASEYSSKFWMVADAISRNRTDGALVRLITPMREGEENARARLKSFTQLLFPYLDELIPN